MLGRWVMMLLVVAATLLGPALAKELPPVIQELGPVVPTPVPSPERAERIRLITSFTLQNKPEGASIISFEATDMARSKKEEAGYRTIAVELYSLVEPKKGAREIRQRIMTRIRDLERDLLEYVEVVGPPRERASLGAGPASAPQR